MEPLYFPGVFPAPERAPLGFYVDSDSDSWTWYFVDLGERNGKGFCECRSFQIHVDVRNPRFEYCRHIIRAREYMLQKIERGEYDHYLK